MSSHGLVVIPRPDTLAAPPACTVNDVLEAWLAGRNPNTLRGYAFDLQDFARFAKLKTVDAAVEMLLAAGAGQGNRIALAYRAHLLGRQLAPATIARRLAALRSLVKLGRQLGRITWTLDVEGPRTKAYRDTRGPGLEGWRRIRTRAAQLAGQGVAGKRDLAIVRLLHDLGLRRGEAVAMDLDDVDLDAGKCGEIRIVGKGKLEPEMLTLNAPTRDALRAWITARGRKGGPLFIRLDPAASPGDLDRLSGDAVERMVKRLSRRAGLSREARPHGLRHQGITRALDLAGGDVRKVRQFSRHAHLDTLLRYDDNRRDEAGVIAGLLGDDE
jgi:integrase/recombinase XerC